MSKAKPTLAKWAGQHKPMQEKRIRCCCPEILAESDLLFCGFVQERDQFFTENELGDLLQSSAKVLSRGFGGSVGAHPKFFQIQASYALHSEWPQALVRIRHQNIGLIVSERV